MNIGIYGSAAGDMIEEAMQKAEKIGEIIAKKGHTVVTGGCTGIPQQAVLAAHKNGGKCIGFSPAINQEQHEYFKYPTDGFSKLVFIPENYTHKDNQFICKKYRNVSSVAFVDIAIIISGRIGSMNEFTNAFDMQKDIGVLVGTGGITERAIQILLEDAKKESKSRIVFDSDPEKLIEKLLS